MQTLSLPTEEEIRAAARQGEDAVVALVVGLMSDWVDVIQQQQEIIHRLEERVQALEDQLAKNSSNSGKPPSSSPSQSAAVERQEKRRAAWAQRVHAEDEG